MLLQSLCCTLMVLAAAAAAAAAAGKAQPTLPATSAHYIHSSLSLGGTLQAHARLADAITTGSARRSDSVGPRDSSPQQPPTTGGGSGSGSGDKGSMGGSQRLSQSYVSSKSGSGVVQCTFKVRFLPSEWIMKQLDLGSGGSAGGILAIFEAGGGAGWEHYPRAFIPQRPQGKAALDNLSKGSARGIIIQVPVGIISV